MIKKDIREEAERIIDLAEKNNLPLKLLGGLAIYLKCPSAAQSPFKREYSDIDVIGYSKSSSSIQTLFMDAGYIGDHEFNTMYGHERLFFWDEENHRQVDVFLDKMKLCHTIDLRERLETEAYTLSLSDLILTKLQIIEVNKKDITDALAVFKDHEVGDNDEEINISYISSILSKDWGFWRTITGNLEKLKYHAKEMNLQNEVVDRINILNKAIEKEPKSFKWKLRSYVGERVRWYELPAEEEHG
ncbi:hypothetical protein ACLIBG_09090 [Virgibacillus sp. W0181]|uniref:hypothetical protein n=1 Tax=Virgibacillus sp. W0181 TaxID=3391581 RepID=UPI003F481986